MALTRFCLLTWVVSQGLQSRLFFTAACKNQHSVRWLLSVPSPSPPASLIFLSLELCWNHHFYSHVVNQVRAAVGPNETCFFSSQNIFFPAGSICLSGLLNGCTNGCAGTVQGDYVVANEQLKAILLLNVTLDSKWQARDRCCFGAQQQLTECLIFERDTVWFTASKAGSHLLQA